MSAQPWSDDENDAIVAEYFGLLTAELIGRPKNKAEVRRSIQTLTGRAKGAIEYKNQNISAIMLALGQDWVRGYKPAHNYQHSLRDAVLRWLNTYPEWANHLIEKDHQELGFAAPEPLWIGPPPALQNAPEPEGLDSILETGKLCDVAARDESNRRLGEAGEARILAHELSNLRNAGRADLAEKVDWVSKTRGDGLGYDIHSFEPDGRERLIEVKTTGGWERTPFYLSRNEISVAEGNREHWCLVRVWNFYRDPKAFEIRPPLQAHIKLTPSVFEAGFH
ncbi:DUF3883 domain-containing protein [Hoeflea sp.]|uniref:DUF3883 domain-containing protein n=1 Tax=Hoeflea sp. TaxID=1940281 RepID=UPI003749F320